MKSWVKRWWKRIGPGFITGAGDDDPSGITTYTHAGAAFGLQSLWTAWLSIPLMISIQEMCARIGLVQQKGLTEVIKGHYPKWILYVVLLLSFPAITLNIGANIAAIGAVGHMLFPSFDSNFIALGFIVLMLWLMIQFPYQRIAGILKWICFVLLVYAIVPFLYPQSLKEILFFSFVPHIEWNAEFAAMLVAILGTTISPYLFFWQANMEKEEIIHKHTIVSNRILHAMRRDVRIGMVFSNLIMYFIILTAATVFHHHKIYQINTVHDAAQALYPLAGKFAYLLFSIGIIGTGLLAIPILSGALSYMMAETFNWPDGLDKKFNQAKGFYITMIVSMILGFSIHILKISPIKALWLTAVLYGLIAPFLIGLILHISNSKKIMGEHVNTKRQNFWGMITLILMGGAALFYIFSTLTDN
jgi:NRAMP (natural resistance-associated macrophage protein)-like metal ion transporter